MSEVVVIAYAKAQPGREDEIERALRENAATSRNEAGCVSYAVLRGDDGTFMTLERWRSREEVDQHMTTAHVQLLLQTIVPMLAAPPQISVMKEV
ncbi:MAG TPA: putative quinol monooxygenase [Thermoanaerobaculia bacterium]|nr:putative quinol monooxygenase [Thermoanaerobaculia bacterium]